MNASWGAEAAAGSCHGEAANRTVSPRSAAPQSWLRLTLCFCVLTSHKHVVGIMWLLLHLPMSCYPHFCSTSLHLWTLPRPRAVAPSVSLIHPSPPTSLLRVGYYISTVTAQCSYLFHCLMFISPDGGKILLSLCLFFNFRRSVKIEDSTGSQNTVLIYHSAIWFKV